ncbi:MAG: hypothetical protein ACD_2C00050G0010 [uncultured bacterium (gcode 4)]|uniref:Uncharacterized protein n=1 Tax=uncultured bacterium (gcode 4) TaxID=1234023 RepID=K2H2H3_9BACT|nr:MAG: hypothetical protein ACD_2C00050G0010 [uncultured bacterium (gcode 4)]
MKQQKIIAALALFSLMPIYSAFAALDVNQLNQVVADLQRTVGNYAETIRNLQDENAKLKKVIESYMASTWNKPAATPVSAPAVAAPLVPATWASSKPVAPVASKASSVDKYNKLIDKVNSYAQDIFSSSDMDSSSSIWLFEFIEPNSFFISIDDGKNPAWQSAFRKKILYSYDANFNLNVDWVFELDYNSWYYKTLQGKNPFAKATRIRVKNPAYNWKLLTPDSSAAAPAKATTATASSNAPVASSSSAPKNVTLDSIKSAYNKNSILDALKLSTEYIKTDPNNLDVAKIRYRSFYILWKYAESLTEVQKIEALIWLDKMEKVVACDAKTIAKLAKNADLNKKYADACSTKK